MMPEYRDVTVKYDGSAHQIALAELDLPNPSNPTDAELLTALALHFDTEALSNFAIDRFDNVINVRPSASYAQ